MGSEMLEHPASLRITLSQHPSAMFRKTEQSKRLLVLILSISSPLERSQRDGEVHMRDRASKPRIRLSRIVEMNLGFLGIQFSFGLQQANMGPIYRYLGADEAHLPLL